VEAEEAAKVKQQPPSLLQGDSASPNGLPSPKEHEGDETRIG
jgi:hypothetical protein